MSSLAGLVTGVAHEINTPIGVSTTAVTYLKDRVSQMTSSIHSGDISKEDLIELMLDMEQSAELLQVNLKRASDLVSGFKQVSVMETKEEDAGCKFNLYENLTQSLNALKEQIDGAQCQISIDCDKGLTFFGTPNSFSQIYTNLALNSLNHAFNDWSGDRTISISIKRKASRLYIKYEDSGCGMDSEMKEQIFEPFVTSKRGHREHHGLGAHVVFNIVVQLLKGKISCHSVLGHGVTFDISIPYVES